MKDVPGPVLSSKERRLILLLGIPSAGLSSCLTVLSTYLPVLARQFTSSTTVIGMLVGGEGLIAVLIPVWVGRISDRTETRLGRRLPFLIATAPVVAIAISVIPFAPSLEVMAVEVFFFYLAYFTYFAPYQALYPDLRESSPGSAWAARSSAADFFSRSGGRCPTCSRRPFCCWVRPYSWACSAGAPPDACRPSGISAHRPPTYGSSCASIPISEAS